MINNISSILNSRLRFTGMASGLDTDSIVSQMMLIESMKVDKMRQDRQILEWRRDDYRSITNALRSFKDDFFDILKPANYMRSSNTYYSYTATSSNTSVVTASGSGQISMLNHSIEVTRLAKAATMEASSDSFSAEGLSVNSTISEMADKYGLTMTEGKLSFGINGETIEINGDKRVSDLMNSINNSKANVKISYSSFLDKFTMSTKTMGAEAKIEFTENTELFVKLGFQTSTVTGQDAEFKLDNKTATRSSNVFNIDGVIYSLKGEGTADIALKQDTDAIFDKIKTFIDKYNELVDTITGKVNESRPKTSGSNGSYYLPLTDEQKQVMKEDDIKKWEESAKKGLIKNDSILNDILFNMRRAMGDATEAGTLASIGVSTGDWREGARLFIDEEKLRKAIEENPDNVMSIFAKQPEKSYDPDATAADRKQRYEESGLVERLFDILQDNIRTTRNEAGKKGLLLEKAGIVGDLTEFQSTLVNEINKKDLLIEDMMRKLYIKEESLYRKFATLETSLNRMNAQSAWLSQSLGGGQ